MSQHLPEPSDQSAQKETAQPRELLLRYLDFYRSEVARKLDGLSDAESRTSRMPSGWSPLELLNHLVHMERRWLVWGFAGENVAEPWGDEGPDGRWVVDPSTTREELVNALHEGGRRTRAIVEVSDLAQLGATGGRFAADRPPPTLAFILFHVLQEYARHTGHLDVARELADGLVGEDPSM